MRRLLVMMVVAAFSLPAGEARAECRTVCVEGEQMSIRGCCEPRPKSIDLPNTSGKKPKPYVKRTPVKAAEFSRDGMRVVSADEKVARVRDVGTAKVLLSLEHGGYLSDVAFSPDGKQVATTGSDSRLKTWDARTGKLLFEVLTGGWAPRDLEYSPEGTRILTAGAHSSVWDAKTGTKLAAFSHGDEVADACWSADGARIATAGADKVARIWDAKTGKESFALKHDGGVRHVEFSADGSRIVTASNDKTARLWDAASGKAVLTLTSHTHEVTDATLSVDGSRLATASRDKTARIWDPKAGTLLLVLRGHTDDVNDVEFSPDGKHLLTSSADDTLRIWNVASGEQVDVVEQEAWVSRASFSSDGKWIVTAGGESAPRIVEFSPR